MSNGLQTHAPVDPVYVSTGSFPSSDVLQALVSEAYEQHKTNADGQNSQVYPALATATRDLFGVCVVGTGGHAYSAGDADHE